MLKRSSYTSRHSQKGSIHVIVSLALVVAIIGTVGYLFWNRVNANENLIDYDPYVHVESETDIEQLIGAPESFKKFILGRVDTVSKSNAETREECYTSISVVTVARDAYAMGDVDQVGDDEKCKPGLTEAWALDDAGAWQVVDSTQDDIFKCDKLQAYAVPLSIAGDQCYQADGKLTSYSE